MKKNLAIILSAIICVFSLISCSGQSTPTEVTENYFTNLSAGEYTEITDDIVTILQANGSTYDETEIRNAINTMFSKIQVEVTNENIDNDTATVDVSLSGISLYKIITDVYAEAMSSDMTSLSDDELASQLNSLVINKINNAAVEERTGTLNLTKTDGEWTLNTDDEAFSNLVLGSN